MRVRIRFDPRGYWIIETKRWYDFLGWMIADSVTGDNAYERAHFYARALKYPQIEEIK
jgi:hypothetical protein